MKWMNQHWEEILESKIRKAFYLFPGLVLDCPITQLLHSDFIQDTHYDGNYDSKHTQECTWTPKHNIPKCKKWRVTLICTVIIPAWIWTYHPKVSTAIHIFLQTSWWWKNSGLNQAERSPESDQKPNWALYLWTRQLWYDPAQLMISQKTLF